MRRVDFRGTLPTLAVGMLLGAAVAVAGNQAAADAPRARQGDLLTEPEQLQERLGDPDVRILDVRPAEDYARGHIPGAVWVDLDDWKELSLSDGGLHDADAWAGKVGRLGIDRETPVVVYGENITETARVWWLLKYVGVEDVSLLNGGWQVWTAEQRPTERDEPRVAARRFRPRFQADRLEEIDTLKESLGREGVAVVDARSEAEFAGEDVRGPRGGHIPEAVHLEWKDLLAADGRFKPPDELRELFRRRGIRPDDTAVCY